MKFTEIEGFALIVIKFHRNGFTACCEEWLCLSVFNPNVPVGCALILALLLAVQHSQGVAQEKENDRLRKGRAIPYNRRQSPELEPQDF